MRGVTHATSKMHASSTDHTQHRFIASYILIEGRCSYQPQELPVPVVAHDSLIIVCRSCYIIVDRGSTAHTTAILLPSWSVGRSCQGRLDTDRDVFYVYPLCRHPDTNENSDTHHLRKLHTVPPDNVPVSKNRLAHLYFVLY